MGVALLLLAANPLHAAERAAWCHRVRIGETLSSIARRHGTSVATLARLNRLPAKATLPASTVLRLPALAALRHGRLPLAPRTLAARAGNLERENRHANTLGLSRMRDHAMVRRFLRAGLLVPVPARSRTFRVEGVPDALRVARPWTRRFVDQLAAAAHDLFGTRLKITSLTRTVSVQSTLDRSNLNAAPADGPRRSSHLTGASVDISKRSHTPREILWLRTVLGRLERQGLVLAIEEFAQPHFHVLVLPRYGDYARRLPSPSLFGGC